MDRDKPIRRTKPHTSSRSTRRLRGGSLPLLSTRAHFSTVGFLVEETVIERGETARVKAPSHHVHSAQCGPFIERYRANSPSARGYGWGQCLVERGELDVRSDARLKKRQEGAYKRAAPLRDVPRAGYLPHGRTRRKMPESKLFCRELSVVRVVRCWKIDMIGAERVRRLGTTFGPEKGEIDSRTWRR